MDEPVKPSSTSESGQPAQCKCGSATRVAGWTAGTAAFFAATALINEPTWPVAVGVAAVSVSVAVVCSAMLRQR